MTRSHVVVVDPLAPSELLEYNLEGRLGTFLVELLELAQGTGIEWIQIGEGTLVERILARRSDPPPSPEKVARAKVNAKYYVKAKGKGKGKAKYPTTKRRKKCPHCGELFAARGIGPHITSVHTKRAEFMARAKHVAQLKAERRAQGAYNEVVPPASQ